MLITGAAGFIGFHLAIKMLENGIPIIGFDNLNTYYDINLKKARLSKLHETSEKIGTPFYFVNGDLENKESIEDVFSSYNPKKVVNLAAQAGVRYSLENPSAYIQSNLVGFANILEACRKHEIEHLVYASSSSVYGGNVNLPFSEKDGVDHPLSLYAATKKSNELMAHTYSNLYNLPTTGLRFFTVYGPWGRPDMALFLFTSAIFSGEPIKVFNEGKMIRDFTYIDDICESLVRVIEKPPIENNDFDFKNPNPSKSWAPYRIFNIGNSSPTELFDYILALEKSIGRKAKVNLLPMQQGDVPITSADTSELAEWIGFKPSTSIEIGVGNFVNWYRDFYNI